MTFSSRRFAASLLATFSLSFAVGCTAPDAEDSDEPLADTEEAVTGGKITTARPEIGLVHVDGVRGFLGDMGWATGTVVLARNAVLTSAQSTGGRDLAFRDSGWGTFTVTTSRGRSVHRIVAADVVDDSKLALLRIDPPVTADVTPAAIAPAGPIDRSATSTFLGYGFRNLVCLPMTGSDGNKSYVTRRYRDFGGLFTGPLGVGYTCEGDIGGPIVAGERADRGAVLSINVNTAIDRFEQPGLHQATLERIVQSWQ